jgi:hypothetical protein
MHRTPLLTVAENFATTQFFWNFGLFFVKLKKKNVNHRGIVIFYFYQTKNQNFDLKLHGQPKVFFCEII